MSEDDMIYECVCGREIDEGQGFLISELRKKNPYPKDIFTPLSDKETKKYVKVLTDNGFSSDKIHAHWMRYSWDLCVDQLERLFEDE